MFPTIPTMPAVVPVLAAILAADPNDPLTWPNRFNEWVSELPTHLVGWWHGAVQVLTSPWLPLAVLLVIVNIVALRLAYVAVWRQAVAGGYWMAITAPRSVDPSRDAVVWRVLLGLAVRARGSRWRLARPPLTWEVYAAGGRLTAGLWLPRWMPARAVVAELARAWPGATVQAMTPPSVDRDGAMVAGYRLRASGPQTGWLVDNLTTRSRPARGTGSDPDIGSVLAALNDPDGPTLLQVLVRPATGRRMRRLRSATVRPPEPERNGVQVGVDIAVWLVRLPLRVAFAVLDLFTTHGTPTASRTRDRQPPTPVEREEMAEAKAKLKARPHLLVSIRVVAARPTRAGAREAAHGAADGFRDASRLLDPVALRRPAAVAADRWAGRGEWVLVTGDELAVLAHLPADPAFYGFATAALHRGAPPGTARGVPERPGSSSPGWTGRGWGEPPAEQPTADDDDPDDAPRGRPYRAADPPDWDDDEDENPYE